MAKDEISSEDSGKTYEELLKEYTDLQDKYNDLKKKYDKAEKFNMLKLLMKEY